MLALHRQRLASSMRVEPGCCYPGSILRPPCLALTSPTTMALGNLQVMSFFAKREGAKATTLAAEGAGLLRPICVSTLCPGPSCVCHKFVEVVQLVVAIGMICRQDVLRLAKWAARLSLKAFTLTEHASCKSAGRNRRRCPVPQDGSTVFAPPSRFNGLTPPFSPARTLPR